MLNRYGYVDPTNGAHVTVTRDWAYFRDALSAPRPVRDNVRYNARRARLATYRILAQKIGHRLTVWQQITPSTMRTECHECEAPLTVDFRRDRDGELTIADAIDNPCMVTGRG